MYVLHICLSAVRVVVLIRPVVPVADGVRWCVTMPAA